MRVDPLSLAAVLEGLSGRELGHLAAPLLARVLAGTATVRDRHLLDVIGVVLRLHDACADEVARFDTTDATVLGTVLADRIVALADAAPAGYVAEGGPWVAGGRALAQAAATGRPAVVAGVFDELERAVRLEHQCWRVLSEVGQ